MGKHDFAGREKVCHLSNLMREFGPGIQPLKFPARHPLRPKCPTGTTRRGLTRRRARATAQTPRPAASPAARPRPTVVPNPSFTSPAPVRWTRYEAHFHFTPDFVLRTAWGSTMPDPLRQEVA